MANKKVERQLLLKAIVSVLRPLVRMIMGLVKFPELKLLLQSIYVEEAKRQLLAANPKKRPSNTDITVLTGIDSRQYERFSEYDPLPALFNNFDSYRGSPISEGALLSTWATSRLYRDRKTGRPKKIPIIGKGASIHRLVASHFPRGVTAQSVLRQLQKYGNVRSDGQMVRLISPVYLPPARDAVTLRSGLEAVGHHVLAVQNNYERGDEAQQFTQRTCWSSNIPEEKFNSGGKALKKLLAKQADQLQRKLEQLETGNKKSSGKLFGGGYYYIEADN